MFELYDEIMNLFDIYDKVINFDITMNTDYISHPPLTRQICVKYESHNTYNILKMVYDSLIKKIFIIEKYDIITKNIYDFEKIGFDYSYNLTCRNLDIENPNYNDYNNFYILVNTLNTIYINENDTNFMKNFEFINNYFNKKNNILLKNVHNKYRILYDIMKKKNFIDKDIIDKDNKER